MAQVREKELADLLQLHDLISTLLQLPFQFMDLLARGCACVQLF